MKKCWCCGEREFTFAGIWEKYWQFGYVVFVKWHCDRCGKLQFVRIEERKYQ